MRRISIRIAVPLLLIWLALGPLPADNTPYKQTGYYTNTLARLHDLSPLQAVGPLAIGFAEADISPPAGHPLAGFGGRKPKAATGIDTPCFARALSLSVAGKTVTLLSGDILLANQALVDAILQRSGLPHQQLYVTASHTHSGPGGHARGPIHEQVFGEFQQAYFDQLAAGLAQLVTRSRQTLQPAEFARFVKELPGRQQNRIDPQAATHDQLSLLLFRQADASPARTLAILAVFGAHATVLGAGNRLVSADYPGHLVNRLKQHTRADTVLFAAGAVGDARPWGLRGNTPYQRANDYGKGLADAVLPDMATLTWQRRVTLAAINLPIDLPPVRIPLGSHWTLGPLLTRLVADRQGRMSALRLNDVLLTGFPVDYAGHLASDLRDRLQPLTHRPLVSVATSFSGGYKGYLVSSDWYFRTSTYETRNVNFFGPWAGDYLNDLALKMASRLF
jgi:neutral ceramidase